MNNGTQNFNILAGIDWFQIIKEVFNLLISFWQLWLFLLGILIIRLFLEVLIPNEYRKFKSVLKFRKSKKWHSDKELLSYLRNLEPGEFEEYTANLFDALGFKTKVVGQSHDGGIDVVAEKDGVKNYIQCKKFITRKVGVHDVRDFVGALAGKLADGKGYFITTNVFTLDALKYAEGQPIELIDGSRLTEYIRMAQDKGWEPKKKEGVCPKCNGELIKRKGKFGEFFGCSNYPKCEYTHNIKSDPSEELYK